MAGDDTQPDLQIPTGSGRARELSRTRAPRPKIRDTGRRHHIGEVPPVITVIKTDGTVGTTRTSSMQLKDQTVARLESLAATIAAEMSRAAASLDFEMAAHLRDELESVRRELGSR